MKHRMNYTVSTATKVLALTREDVAPFVQNCLSDRSLSWVVAELNKAVLNGGDDEREEAQRALDHLGFI